MNRKNLTQIFDNYVARFEELTALPDPDESYKWRAVHNFQAVFDLNAPDFAAMLKTACKATSNMIDSQMQPFGGLVVMAEKDGEAETIRQMFRALYAEDGGDLAVRQDKIDAFLKSCDALLAKHYPGSFRYKNDQRSAMAYLWFHEPDTHYLCKTTEARYLADAAEFYDDWGTYASFRLKVFYRFCDALIEEMRRHPALMAVHKSRFEGHESKMHPDNALHILAFDVIYCAATYGLYTGVAAKRLTAADIRLYQQRKAKAAELSAALTQAEADMRLLQDGIAKAQAFVRSGAGIRHRVYGDGVLQKFDGQYLTVLFPRLNAAKQFVLASALANGYLTLDAPDLASFLSEYGAVLRQAEEIPKRLEAAQKDLEPYISYLA